MQDQPDVARGPERPTTGQRTQCNGDPTDLDGGSHPWVLVDDSRGDLYRCPDCGATDTD